jgi:hypothetical protein
MTLPASRLDLKKRRWVEGESRPCKLCGTPIEFWRSPDTGKIHPLEVRAELDWVLDTHFRYCPRGEEMKKRNAPAKKAIPKTGNLFP